MQFPNPIVNRLVIYGSDGLPDITIGPTPLITFYNGTEPMIYIGLWGGATNPRFRIFDAGDPDQAYIELALSGNIPYIKFNGFVGLTPVTALIQMVGTSGIGRLRLNAEPLATNASLSLANGLGIVFEGSPPNRAILFDRTDGLLKVGTSFPWVLEGWITLPLTASWVTDTWTPQYRKMPDGQIILRGWAVNGTTADNTVIANLPAGYRPQTEPYFICAKPNQSTIQATLSVTTGGAVTIRKISNQLAAATATLSFDEIRFSSI